MSQEQVARNLTQDTTLEFVKERKVETQSVKVDINILMDRARAEKKKEKKENLIFLSLIGSVILITGVIASF
ncbi:MAG: hypothetical protein H8E55_11905 [Pelagibacterales bacterium]|nr:hypothetical protein [Pelagibacterales bacterium]